MFSHSGLYCASRCRKCQEDSVPVESTASIPIRFYLAIKTVTHCGLRIGGEVCRSQFPCWQLMYNASDMIGPSVTVYLQECKSPIMLPVEQAMDTALGVLRAAATTELFYRQHAWDAVRCYLVASISLDDDEQMQTYFFTHPRSVMLLSIVFCRTGSRAVVVNFGTIQVCLFAHSICLLTSFFPYLFFTYPVL